MKNQRVLLAIIPSTAAISQLMWEYWNSKYKLEHTKTQRNGKHWLKIWGLK